MQTLSVFTTLSGAQLQQLIGNKGTVMVPVTESTNTKPYVKAVRGEDGQVIYSEKPEEFKKIGDLSEEELAFVDIVYNMEDKYKGDLYLTKLLGQFSSNLNTEREVNRNMITTLQEKGVLSIGKIKAEPHDYSVVRVNLEHPAYLEWSQE